VNKIKYELTNYLTKINNGKNTIVAYGAAAKGNTLLNYCGIDGNLISVVFDKSKSKQNKFMPGSNIPIKNTSEINNYKPDYIMILPWNLSEEIMKELQIILLKPARFFKAIPNLIEL